VIKNIRVSFKILQCYVTSSYALTHILKFQFWNVRDTKDKSNGTFRIDTRCGISDMSATPGGFRFSVNEQNQLFIFISLYVNQNTYICCNLLAHIFRVILIITLYT
jgi:hypothetical protein